MKYITYWSRRNWSVVLFQFQNYFLFQFSFSSRVVMSIVFIQFAFLENYFFSSNSVPVLEVLICAIFVRQNNISTVHSEHMKTVITIIVLRASYLLVAQDTIQTFRLTD